jgi:magnesium-transporting ATPase (P-type)
MTAFLVTRLRAGWRPGDPTGRGTALHHAYLEATTATFVAIVACQVGTAFAARTAHQSLRAIGVFTNRMLLWGIAFELSFTAVLVYVPIANELMRTAPLDAATLLLVTPFPLVVWAADELWRWRRRRADDDGSGPTSRVDVPEVSSLGHADDRPPPRR